MAFLLKLKWRFRRNCSGAFVETVLALLSKLNWRFCRNMNVGFLHTGLSFLSNIDCRNPALWRGRRCNACGMPGFIARQQRKQAIQPDPRESLRRDADPHFFPDSGTRQLLPRGLLFAAREADLLGPLGDRIADPGLQLPARLPRKG